ncbi:MAG: ABC transporter permease subunit [Deltaproteobacteria bacterium]|nr:ABC transporter permease subunit [Deltaproteobacteria bacterium]PWB66466.1 MAG: ABC transporter permease [Deltaproteobacteria bacterium]
MDFLFSSFAAALRLIGSLSQDVVDAVRTSLAVSAGATVFAALLGIPIGFFVGHVDFPAKRIVVTLLNTLMALPTVVVGLLVYGFLSRQGPLGVLGLLFTPTAIVIGGVLLAAPIVANYALTAVRGADPRIFPTALTLGAGRLQAFGILMGEIRFGMLAAVIAGFGRVVSEVGVAMMLGGNIRGYTRTMTTAIALETSKGEFAFGMALGIVLMSVALCVNLFLNLLQRR